MEFKIMGTIWVSVAGILLFIYSLLDKDAWFSGIMGFALMGLGLYMVGTLKP